MINKLDYNNIEFLVSLKQIIKIEKQNNINVNIFGYDDKQVFPLYISKENFDDHMELLLISEKENNIMFSLKILTDLCLIKQNAKLKTFLYVLPSMLFNRKDFRKS